VKRNISKKLRFEVFKRDEFTCKYCGKSPPEVVLNLDHKEAFINGGTNDFNNLITSCENCNQGKGSSNLNDPVRDINSMSINIAVPIKWNEKRKLYQATWRNIIGAGLDCLTERKSITDSKIDPNILTQNISSIEPNLKLAAKALKDVWDSIKAAQEKVVKS
jgi:hypothetical protein